MRAAIAPNAGRGGRQQVSAGITLIELLVTMAIVAVGIAVVGPPVGSAVDRVRLRSAANTILAETRYGRTAAETSGTTVWMTFSDRSVRLQGQAGDERTIELPAGTTIRATPPVVLFSSSGRVAGPESIEIENEAGIAVLELDPTSGRFRRRLGSAEDQP